MSQTTHYTDYDVMKEKPNWDPHTQSIVEARLLREAEHRYVTQEEAELLRSICTRVALRQQPVLIDTDTEQRAGTMLPDDLVERRQ